MSKALICKLSDARKIVRDCVKIHLQAELPNGDKETIQWIVKKSIKALEKSILCNLAPDNIEPVVTKKRK